MPSDNPITKGQPGSTAAALFGCCPRCNERTLFEGPVKFAPRCAKCELDFSTFNVGDGPAGFLTLIIGALITGLALWLEVSVKPPFWVHIILWVPLTTGAVVLGLRMAKAALLQAEYHQRAGEARNSSESDDI